MERKTCLCALSNKISEDQRQQLIHWLARHTYKDVIAMAKEPAPNGLGLEISRSALGRFYQTHFDQIDFMRQREILDRSLEHEKITGNSNTRHTRYMLHHSSALRLHEHLSRLLSEPVESVADLKALAHVSKTITQLGVDLRDPERQGYLRDMIEDLLIQRSKAQTPANVIVP